MIVGIGTDIVAVARLREMLDRYGERFASRILTEAEMAAFRGAAVPAAFLAKRFAAKEAAAKAFGTGFRDGLSLRHIGVENNAHGRPALHFSGCAAEISVRLGVTAAHLSLADEKEYAVAFVVLDGAA
jgi:holo-[acyl-carrier protein] synthase